MFVGSLCMGVDRIRSLSGAYIAKDWSRQNNMHIKYDKTNYMILGTILMHAIQYMQTYVNSSLFCLKLKSILNQIFIFVLIKTFIKTFSNHFNATNNKNMIIVCVNSTNTYKLFDSCKKTVSHCMTTL